MTTYVTFGFDHVHTVNGLTLNKDCVAAFPSSSAEEGRTHAFQLFGAKFCFEYFNKLPNMEYFPRGVIQVEDY